MGGGLLIKFRAIGDNGKVALGFGISEENVKRLKEGKPIYVDLAELGINGSLMIFYGKTEADLVATIKPYIGKDTSTHGLGN